jgi:hypothetical protein
MHVRTGLCVLIGCVAAAGLAIATRAIAVDGTIHGCYQKNEGQLRIVPEGKPCRPSEVAISWNAEGPPGPPGTAGSPGVAGLQRVHFSSKNDSESRKDAFAKCPDGKHVVGGGAQVFIGEDRVLDGPIAIKKSWPSDTMDGWAATAEEITPTDLRWHVTAYALCANVAD